MALLHRRSFIQRIGLGAGAGLLSPIVKTLVAEAQGTLGTRKRFIVFLQGNGFHWNSFVPTEFAGKGTIFGKDLLQSASYTLPERLAPLAPFRSRMLLVDGLVNQQGRGGHFSGHTLMAAMPNAKDPGEAPGGTSGGQTFDQHVAEVIGKGMPFRSVHLGAATGSADGKANSTALITGSYARARGESIPIQLIPTAAYAQVLGSVSPDNAARGAADRKASLAAGQRVLDFIADDVKRVRGTLASPERNKLDEYLAAVDDAGRRLTALDTAGSSASCGSSKVLADPPTPEERLAAMVDIGTAALACGLTNVLTLNFAGLGSAFRSMGLGESLHNVGHGAPGNWHVRSSLYFAEQLARMLTRLDGIREGNGSILDSSVMMFSSDNGEAHHARNWRWPVVLVGTAGGKLKADGRYIRYPARYENNAAAAVPVGVTDSQRPVGDLFSTLGHALGAPIDDFGKAGMEKVKGPLSELLA